MPAEWEPQEAVWLAPPHNRETWPGCFEQAWEQFGALVDQLHRFTRVRTPGELGIETNDSWIRDYGPVFVRQNGCERPFIHDFAFNTWGGKYEPRPLDDAVPAKMAKTLGLATQRHDFVLEGGSIEVNGQGTVLTTEQCLLSPTRNPDFTREQIETTLQRTLGTRHVIWLPGGIRGDDTDGHIDNLARFIRPHTVVAAVAPAGHPDHEITQRNLAVLNRATDERGRPLRIIHLPLPPPIFYDFPLDRLSQGGRQPLPASYANFLITNAAVFVPTFNQPTDDQAVNILAQALPTHEVIPLRAEHLAVGLGTWHCLTMAQPVTNE